MKKISAYAAIILSAIIFTIFATSARVADRLDINDVSSNVLHLQAIADEELSTPVDPSAERIEQLKNFASGFLGRKYRYGATGPKTFDCSGFTSYVFRNIGIELPRTSRMQYGLGEKIERTDLREGDLVFFSSPSSGCGKVGHVGIVVDVDPDTNSMTFIHASNSKGITYQKFPDGGYFSRNYIGAKRVLDDNTKA